MIGCRGHGTHTIESWGKTWYNVCKLTVSVRGVIDSLEMHDGCWVWWGFGCQRSEEVLNCDLIMINHGGAD